MQIQLNLPSVKARVAVLVVMAALLGLLTKKVVDKFIIFGLSDYRILVDTSLLAPAVDYLPDSPRLLARLAESELKETEPDLESAERHALQAIHGSPNDHNFRLLLGQIREARGDLAGAEEALNDALKLAPNDHVSHYRMANLMIREGKTEAAIDHFRFAINFNPAVLPLTLDLVWQVSGQSIPLLARIVDGNPKAQLKLALFLANRSRTNEAVDTFLRADREAIISSPDTSPFLDALISKGFPKLAWDVWLRAKNPENKNTDQPWIWNGDFETEPSPGLKQFEWQIDKSEYAKIVIDNRVGHSGTHSLSIDFLGRDTTKLDNEIRHLIVLRPGRAYQLDFFVKTENFHTPIEGPGVVVASVPADSLGKWVARSKPISSENTDWQQMSFSFTTPRDVRDWVPLFISIKRQPLYDYDEPTRGRIRFDDFTLREVNGK